MIWSWDAATSDWQGIVKNEYDYNYNAAGQYTQWTVYSWAGGAWVGKTRTTYTYNEAGKTLESAEYTYDAVATNWVGSTKSEYTYDEAGHNLLALTSTLDATADAWIPTKKYEYEYDEAGNQTLDSYYSAYDAATDTWTGSYLKKYAYNSAKKKLLDEQYTWDAKTGAWKGSAKTENEYNAADFDSTAVTYTIRFLDYDGTELQSMELEYGETPEYTGATPEKEPTTEEIYTFSEWSPQVVPVAGDADYTAQFTAQQISQLWFTVNFVNYDDTPLKTINVRYGQYPIYGETAPTHPSDGVYAYEFIGWEPALQIVTADITYKAVYSASVLPTAVDEIDMEANDGPCYNLLGIQVDNDYKGIVIQNGKIFLR